MTLRRFIIYLPAILTALFVFACIFFLAGDVFAQPAPSAAPTAVPAPGQRADIVQPQNASGWAAEMLSPLLKGLTWIAKAICLGILMLFGWMLSVMAFALNLSINFFILGMGEMVKTRGFGVPIEQMWTLMRDLVNVCFIFALIYTGLATIFDISSINTKKALMNIIVGALLVNFSLFFSKAIVDISNIVSLSIFNAATTNQETKGALLDPGKGLTGAIMHRVGMTPLLSGPSGDLLSQFAKENTGIIFWIVYTIGSSIFMMKLAFAFGLGAFLLCMRFIILIFLMIFSPVAFIPSILPGVGGLGKKWWNAILGQAFFAPVYLFAFLLAYMVLAAAPWSASNNMGISAIFLADGKGMTAGVQAIIYFILALVMLIGGTEVARKMATQGVERVTSGATSFATKVVGGGVAIPGRLLNRAARETGSLAGRNIVGRGARLTSRLNDRLSATSGGRAFKTGITAISGGWLDEHKRRELLEKAEKAKFGGSKSLQDAEKLRHKREHWDHEAELGVEHAQRRRVGDAQYNNAINNPGFANQRLNELPQPMQSEIRDLISSVRRLTDAELDKMNVRELTNPNVAMHLTSKQMHHLEHSDRLSRDEFHAIEHAREEGLHTAAGSRVGLDVIFLGRNATEVAALPAAALAQPGVAERLNSSHIEAIRNREPNTIREAERQHIFNEREAALRIGLSAAGTGSAYAQELVRSRSTSEVAQLPKAILEHPTMAERLTPAVLQAILRSGNPNRVDYATVRNNILSLPLPPPPGAPYERTQQWLLRNAAAQEFQ